MEDIKFRAWDFENKVMHYPKIEFDELYVMQLNCGYMGMFNGKAYNTIKMTLMPFTGKRCYFDDNNFKELYEKDIVQTAYGNMECVWNDDKCCFQLENSDYCFDFHQIDVTVQPIIGNSLENPQMLND